MQKKIYSLLIILTLFLGCNSQLSDNLEDQENLSILVISSDVSIGENRIVFAVSDLESKFLNTPLKNAKIINTASNESIVIEPEYEVWSANKGAYSAKIAFETDGLYEIKVHSSLGGKGSAFLQVFPKSETPIIGYAPPFINTKTAQTLVEAQLISSDPEPYLGFYEINFDDAINNNKSTVIIFSTPALCTSGTCGPVLNNLKAVHPKYTDKFNFIHVEIFEDFYNKNLNDVESLTLSDPVKAWKLPTEPWVFFIDNKGILRDKYEGFISKNNIIKTLDSLDN